MLSRAEKLAKLSEWIEARKQYSKVCNDAISLLKKDLSVNCDHPEDFVSPYRWEWDDGYGKQKMMDGKRCTICLKVKRWDSSSIWSDE